MSRQPILQLAHSTDGPHSINGENDNGAHLDDKLDEIGPEDGPHARAGRIRHGDYEADPDRDYFSGNVESEKADVAKAERDREDLDHCLGDPAQDYEVDRNGEVERAEAAQHRCRPAAVTDLRKLDVGHDVGAPPQTGEEKYGQHPAPQHVPAEPVSGDCVLGDATSYDQR